MKLLPSLLYSDFEQFSARFRECVALGGEVHIDFADGEFVPNRLPSVDKVVTLPGDVDLEAHLMVQNPAGWVEAALKDYRFKTIMVHAEAKADIAELSRMVKRAGRKMGLALKPETSIEQVSPYLDLMDQVLILFVSPGFNGSPFIPDMVTKIHDLHKLYPSLEIEADGGMNPDTLPIVQEAGVNRAAIGSYLHEKELAVGLADLSAQLAKRDT